MSKPSSLDAMLAADGEAAGDAAVAAAPADRATVAAVHELGELVRGSLEIAADEAEPRLDALWTLIDRRLDADTSADPVPAAPAAAPAPRPGLGARFWSWLGGHRSHIATGLISAGAVAGLSLALRTSPTERVVVKTVQVPVMQPTQVKAGTPPSVESLELINGSGTVFTLADDDGDGEAAVIWVEPDEPDPTEGI